MAGWNKLLILVLANRRQDGCNVRAGENWCLLAVFGGSDTETPTWCSGCTQGVHWTLGVGSNRFHSSNPSRGSRERCNQKWGNKEVCMH